MYASVQTISLSVSLGQSCRTVFNRGPHKKLILKTRATPVN